MNEQHLGSSLDEFLAEEGLLATVEAAALKRATLLRRLAGFQTAVQRFEQTWGCSLDEMRQRYEMVGREDSEADDAYLEWQWYADAVESLQVEFATPSTS